MKGRTPFAALWLVQLGSLACSRPDTLRTRTHVEFEAVRDDEVRQAGVKITIAGVSVGESDEQGRLQAIVEGGTGASIPWQAHCPEPLSRSSAATKLTLLPFNPLEEKRDPHRLSFKIVCNRPDHTVGVVLRASVARSDGTSAPIVGLPLLVQGQQAAVTDEAGIVHLDVQLTPQENLDIEADTRDTPFETLEPRNPSVTLRGGAQDEIHLVEMRFTKAQTLQRQARTKRKSRGRAIRLYEHGEGQALVELKKKRK